MILFLGCVQCENPNSKIDNFVGNMVSFDNTKLSNHKIEYMEKVSLSPDNILLTGTQLKNTANVFGLCVYAGKETKIHLNSKMTYNKFSSIEHSLNRYLLAYICLMFIQIVFSTIVTFNVGFQYQTDHWYIQPFENISFFEVVKMFVIWNSLYNFIIPIALYCRIEIQKFIGSKFVAWDQDLRQEPMNKMIVIETLFTL